MTPDPGENPSYLNSQIITYIGNKRALLPLIAEGFDIVKRETGKDKLRFLDAFSGTGIVARFAKQHSSLILANDLESYSYVSNRCYLSNPGSLDMPALQDGLRVLQSKTAKLSEGFITELYAARDEQHVDASDRLFYTRRNALFLDTVRQAIDDLPEALRPYFLAPLLAQASVHTNTAGVFKGFYKAKTGVGQFGGSGRHALSRIMADICLQLPVFSNYEVDFEVYQDDANHLITKLAPVDLAYLDPPYNQHPYGSNYFMLNLLCNYERPTDISPVSGIPKTWNRSRYNQKQVAENALFELITNCHASYIMISYNSEGFIPQEHFLGRLRTLGSVRVLEKRYNSFRGSRNLRSRNLYVKEYLFLLKKTALGKGGS